jgi:iron complex transport system permease protein
VLRNPLASSYTLGVSSGASLGVALMILGGATFQFAGMFTLPLVGFVFGLATVLLALAVAARIDYEMSSTTIILLGMVLSLFVNAIIMVVMALSKETAQRLLFWQMGSFSAKDWSHVSILFPLIAVSLLLLMRYTREMDILTFGDNHALASGVDTRRKKILMLALCAFLTGTSVAFVGTVGFVDLIAPHVTRRLFGAPHRIVLPLSAVLGGAFMVIADLAARTVIAPLELPVGAVTALIGAPFFTFIYFKRRKTHV